MCWKTLSRTGAADYWRSAALSVGQRVLTLEVPIAAGLAALYAG